MLRRYDIFANKQRFGYQNGRYSKKTATNPQILGFCCTFAAVLIPSPDGGIGRRAGLKHQWGDPCRFDPGSGYKKREVFGPPFSCTQSRGRIDLFLVRHSEHAPYGRLAALRDRSRSHTRFAPILFLAGYSLTCKKMRVNL